MEFTDWNSTVSNSSGHGIVDCAQHRLDTTALYTLIYPALIPVLVDAHTALAN